MDISHIRSVLEIVRRGSFSEAAAALNISQPAVTLHVQRLERELGARLLERGGSRLRLTTQGEAFILYAERVIEEDDRLRENLARLADDLTGMVRIAASTIPGEYLVPGLLADFVELYPEVTASLTVSDSEAVIEQVSQGDCDIGFTGAPSSRAVLVQEPIYRDTLALVVPANHPFAGRGEVRAVELTAQRFVARENGSGTMASIRHILGEAGIDGRHWTPSVVLGSTQAVISGVEAGLGVSIVSALAARNAVRAGTVAVVPLEGLPPERDLYLVYVEGRVSTRLLQEFTRFTREWSTTRQSGAIIE